jgi:hypothetical protein
VGSFHWSWICTHRLSSMSWSVWSLWGEGNNLDSILSISPVADLWGHESPPQGVGLIVLSMGDGILTHSRALGSQTQQYQVLNSRPWVEEILWKQYSEWLMGLCFLKFPTWSTFRHVFPDSLYNRQPELPFLKVFCLQLQGGLMEVPSICHLSPCSYLSCSFPKPPSKDSSLASWFREDHRFCRSCILTLRVQLMSCNSRHD